MRFDFEVCEVSVSDVPNLLFSIGLEMDISSPVPPQKAPTRWQLVDNKENCKSAVLKRRSYSLIFSFPRDLCELTAIFWPHLIKTPGTGVCKELVGG